MPVPSSSSHVLCVQKNGRLPKDKHSHTGPDDIVYTLVFFSTFEELNLPMKGPMEDSGVVKLYDPSPTPCLYVAPAENMVGRVPLIPLFLAGNSTPTSPTTFIIKNLPASFHFRTTTVERRHSHGTISMGFFTRLLLGAKQGSYPGGGKRGRLQ